ncbi:MAG: hypothetical protein AMXMBFR64_05170 [Myxococcales bacterium]
MSTFAADIAIVTDTSARKERVLVTTAETDTHTQDMRGFSELLASVVISSAATVTFKAKATNSGAETSQIVGPPAGLTATGQVRILGSWRSLEIIVAGNNGTVTVAFACAGKGGVRA